MWELLVERRYIWGRNLHKTGLGRYCGKAPTEEPLRERRRGSSSAEETRPETPSKQRGTIMDNVVLLRKDPRAVDEGMIRKSETAG